MACTYYDLEEWQGYYLFDQQLRVNRGINEGVTRMAVKLSTVSGCAQYTRR
jgi:hypothetical protein